MSLLAPWSLRALVGELKEGRATPAYALARSAGRIAGTEPHIHAWVEHHSDIAPVEDGPLGGVPLGVKDIIDVKGYPTRCGSALRADVAPASNDAAIVDAWRTAGASPVGKTVTTEFAYFSPGPTRNPANPNHTPGGSSSGSAAAVAAGQVPLALGSQTAGSVTRPASYCGVASLVMTQGRYPLDGVVGLSESLDSHGVYTSTVSDLALAWSALTGEPDVGLYEMRPPRILVWTAAPIGGVADDMQDALTVTVAMLEASGATADVFPLEDLIAEVTTAHTVVMAYEASRERAFELGQSSQLSEPLGKLLRTGAAIPEGDYARARAIILDARHQVGAVLADYDAILGAGALGAAPSGLAATGDPVLSRAWQALSLPTVGIPGHRSADGLPIGLQTVGSKNNETGVLATSCWIERTINPRKSE